MFVPTLLGLDLAALSVATSMHERFGIKSHAFGRYRCGISHYSSIMKTHIEPELLNLKTAREVLVNFAKGQSEPCLLVPTSDWYLDLAIKLRGELSPYYTLAIPDSNLYRQLSSKESFYKLLSTQGILYPKTVAFSIGEIPEWYDFPCVLKPARSVEAQRRSFPGAKKVYILENRMQLENTMDLLAKYQTGMRYLLQPYIAAQKSFVLSVFCQEKFGTRRASLAEVIVEEKGASSRGNYSALLVRDLNETARKLIAFCDRIGYGGIANFDIIRRDGKDYVLEMNPRVGRSSDYLRGAGHCVADFLFKSQNRSISYPKAFASVPIYWRCIQDKEVLEQADATVRREIREKIKTNFAFSPFTYHRGRLHPVEALYRKIHLARRSRVARLERQ